MTANRVYGYSQEMYVLRKGGDTFVLGGVTQDGSRWTRVLSKRAAQMLWFHMSRLLFPTEADDVTAGLPTAMMRGVSLPSITQHMVLEAGEQGGIEITGYTSAGTWSVQLVDAEVQRLWLSLDQAMSV
jgi:hypothetical protein